MVIADQVEDAAQAKGLVKREIVKILTPGCIDELEGLDVYSPNYIMAVYEDPDKRTWAICLADISTGELRLGQEANFAGLLKIISSYNPKEILVRNFSLPFVKENLQDNPHAHNILLGVLNENCAQSGA